MDRSDRRSRTPDRRPSLATMAKATQRLPQSSPPAPAPENPKSTQELPPPYDDASGFIDLDKLREAAMAQASFAPSVEPSRPVPPRPPPPFDGHKTAPPVAATVPGVAPSSRSSTVLGTVVGSVIGAAGLFAGLLIASRGGMMHDLLAPPAQQRIAMNAAPHLLPATPATVTPLAAPTAAPPATALAAPTSAPASPAPTAAVAVEADPGAEPGAAPAGSKDLGDLDSSDTSAPSKSKSARAKARLAARRAKLKAKGLDTDPAADAQKAAFLQNLQSSAESNGSPPPAAPVAAEPAPAAAPPAPPARPRTALGAAIEKASGVLADPPPAAVAPPAAPAAAPQQAGLPEAPSQGAIRSALAAQLGQAKACVEDQDAPSRATLTFGSDGRVKSVGVSGPAAGTPAEECIRSALQKTTLAPFSRTTYVVGLSLRPAG